MIQLLEFLAFSKLPLITQFNTTLRVVLQGTDWLGLFPLIPLLGVQNGQHKGWAEVSCREPKLQPHRRTLRTFSGRRIREEKGQTPQQTEMAA